MSWNCRIAAVLISVALAMPAMGQEAQKVVARPPVKQAVTRYLFSQGTIAAINSVDLVARVSGTLQKVNREDGSAVKKGDVLFVIEQEPYQISVASAQAALDQQNANLTQANSNLARQQEMQKKNLTATATVEAAVAQAETAKALVAASEAQLQSAKLNLSYTEIIAPFDGILSEHLIDVGAYINAASTPKLASIIQPDPLRVNFTVNEKQVIQIRQALAERRKKLSDIGPLKVEIGLPTDQNYPYAGTIDYIAPQLDSSSGTISVRAVLANEQRLFSPGMFVRVRVPVVTNADALVIPESAIGNDQQGPTVFTVGKDNRVEAKVVTRGESAGNGLREVVKGLSANDRVIVQGADNVQPGDAVSVVAKLQ
jgi:RND family efflux transporter MFP subunit